MINNIEKTADNLNKFIIKIKYILSWMKIKAELNEKYFNQDTNDTSKPYAVKGDIYFAYLGVNVGAEIDKSRPVLVFQNDDRYIRQSNLVSVFPITSNAKVGLYKVIINNNDITNGSELMEGSILIQQIRSISKNRLSRYMGKLSDEKLKEVIEKSNIYLYKKTPLHMEGDAQTVNDDAAKSVVKV